MSRRSVAVWVAWLALVFGAAAPVAMARPTDRARRVVLMQTPVALERALRTALTPWGMSVARSQTRARRSTPRNAEQARALARQLRADALVWLSESPRRHELWLYDSKSGALTTRGVPPPPFDETRAAALALSVKTELRKGTLAGAVPRLESAAKTVPPGSKLSAATSNSESPIAESPIAETPIAQPSIETTSTDVGSLDATRSADDEPALSGTPTPSGTAPASGTPLPTGTAPEGAPSAEMSPTEAREAREYKEARDALLAEEREPSPSVEEIDRPRFITVAEPYTAPHWRLLLHAGARGGATSLSSTEGRFGVEGRWAPWADPTSIATLWLGVRLDLGLPQTFSNEVFRGEYSELGGGPGVGASVHLNHWLDVGAQVGALVYTASVSGVRAIDSLPAEQSRQGYTVHLRTEVELSLGEFGLVIQPALGTAFARQQYVVIDGNDVPQKALEMSAIWWQLGAAIRVDVD